MKYFLDTEFIEDGKTIDLISLGLVSEDERTLYLINKDVDLSKADDWIKENVLKYLPPRPPETDDTICLKEEAIWAPHASFHALIESFVGDDKDPQFWAYYADYDWVAFCQCWGRMLDLPKHFPKYCLDLKQYSLSKGKKKLPKQETNEHHALADAFWNLRQYQSFNNTSLESL